MDTRMMAIIGLWLVAAGLSYFVLKKSIPWIESSLTNLLRVFQRWAKGTTDFAMSLFRPSGQNASPEHAMPNGEDLEWLALGLLSFAIISLAVGVEGILLAAILGPLFGLDWSFAGAHFDWLVAGAVVASICVFGDTLVTLFSGKREKDGHSSRRIRVVPSSLGIRVSLALMSGAGLFCVAYVVVLAGKMRADVLQDTSMELIATSNATPIIILLAVICVLAIIIDVMTSESLRIVLRLLFGGLSLVPVCLSWCLVGLTAGCQSIAALLKELLGAGQDGQSVIKLADDKRKSLFAQFMHTLRAIFGEESVTKIERKDEVKKPATRGGDIPPSDERATKPVTPVKPVDGTGRDVLRAPRVADGDPEDRELVGVAAGSKRGVDRSQAYQWDYPG